ncbi:MAG: hypothetical protein V2I38_06205 [Alcanivoracaceae bacterium]|jgi:hypothetical protein|nr:hypothetical protein [Alcanivoracaceae bacterium]
MGFRPHSASPGKASHHNVVPLTPRLKPAKPRIVRISPELDGLELLYANDRHPDTLFSIKILCWALLDNDQVVAMAPWLDAVSSCADLTDPLNGSWQGYRLPHSHYLFTEAPQHKADELRSALKFFGAASAKQEVVQEIPDSIGTHAVFSTDGFQSINLQEVISWRLYGDGQLQAMVIESGEVTSTPVLPGDPCLHAAQQRTSFRYFFQHQVANRIKERDPETLAAISILANRRDQ